MNVTQRVDGRQNPLGLLRLVWFGFRGDIVVEIALIGKRRLDPIIRRLEAGYDPLVATEPLVDLDFVVDGSAVDSIHVFRVVKAEIAREIRCVCLCNLDHTPALVELEDIAVESIAHHC